MTTEMRHVSWIVLYWMISVIVECESRCDSELGMKNKTILNITASSQKSDQHSPSFARVDGERAWCSKPDDQLPYIQIDLDETKLITAITTQGSRSDLSWSRKYRVKYLDRGSWKSYKGELKGNRNIGFLRRNKLNPAIRTQSIRIYPKEPYSVMLDSTEPIPSCLRIELHGCPASAPCRDPGVPGNGSRLGDDFRHGKSVKFKCRDYYKRKGKATIYCDKGTWSGDTPQCTGPCPDPGVPDNGERYGNDFRHGKSVTFECNDDFEMDGEPTIRCHYGTWTDDIPKCKVNKKDCADIYSRGQTVSGVYTIHPDGQQAFDVYCDQTTAGGGWTVFQTRLDGSVDFYRGWADYKAGFGHLTGEYWLGLDKLHGLTTNNTKRYKLRVDLEETSGNTAYAEYGYFAVSSEQAKYQLSLNGTYHGTAGDSLSYHKSRAFSTKDRDNDSWGNNCAVSYHGAWWYGACHHSNLNGRYLHGNHPTYANGVNWKTWKGYYNSVERAEMKIRPADWIPL